MDRPRPQREKRERRLALEQSQEHSEPQQEEYELHRCSFHPEVETGLGCGKCGRYICPRCMIQTPVGARCRECVTVTTLPTFEVAPSYYIRAVVAGGIAAIVGGILWNVLLRFNVPFVPWISAIGVGYLVGEAISVATNRKRGRGLAIVAGTSMVIAILVSGFLPQVSSPIGFILWLFLVGIAFSMAISRVR